MHRLPLPVSTCLMIDLCLHLMMYLRKKFSDSDGKDMHEVTERQIELLEGEGQKYGCFDF